MVFVSVGNGGNNSEGFVGGGQVGYNYQFTPGSGLVVGLEADAQYTDFSNKFASVPRVPAVSFTGTCRRVLLNSSVGVRDPR